MQSQLRVWFAATLILGYAQPALRAQLVADGQTFALTTGTNFLVDLTVGTNSGNTMVNIVGPGGRLTNLFGFVGRNASSTNNQVMVDQDGAFWRSSVLYVGSNSPGNRLVITNSGRVFVLTESRIGGGTGSSNNQVIVTGTNSSWRNIGALVVGNNGSGNSLLIADGASVSNANGSIAAGPGASNNIVTVTGVGSSWTNSGTLTVGALSRFNTLLVTSGGVVSGGSGDIGALSTPQRNVVSVSGSGSLLTVSNSLTVNGSFNSLLITNGGRAVSAHGKVGLNLDSTSNQAIVTGNGSAWICSANMTVGEFGGKNSLLISDGGWVESFDGIIGHTSGFGGPDNGKTNLVVVSGSGSVWTNRDGIHVGNFPNHKSTLVITNGGAVLSSYAFISYLSGPSDPGGNVFNPNRVVVTGAGSLWSSQTDLTIRSGELMIEAGGHVFCGRDFWLTNLHLGSLVLVDGGTMTNAGMLNLSRGTFRLNSGSVTASNFFALSLAVVDFNGGTLSVSQSTVSNSQPLIVGDGNNAATFALLGNGLHSFTNGLVLSNNAVLQGNGTISGALTISAGATVTPGTSIGKLILDTTPSLQGVCLMEISRNNGTLTNDQVEVTGPLVYGGSLIVTNIGPDALALGDSFRIFIASAFSGALNSIQLPPLGPGLTWTNRLLVDGSIAVILKTTPMIESFGQSGPDLVLSVTGGSPGGVFDLLASTNATLPMTNWTVVSAGNFDWLGNAALVVGIDPFANQQFFRLRVP